MKNALFVAFALLGIFACKNNSEASHDSNDHNHDHDHSAVAKSTYNVSAGTIYWTGSKPVGDNHTGTITVSEGKIGTNEDGLVSGKFTIDMSSISATDLEGEWKEKLDGHLMNADFFNVDSFPTATFEITSVTPVTDNADVTHNITGDLTMKGHTHSVTVPANVLVAEDKVSIVSTKFDIDRTKWDVQYNSGKFFSDLKDKLINDEINLNVSLEATK